MSGPRDSFYVDFSNYKDRSSSHLPEGKYLVRVVDAEIGEIKSGDNAGKPMVTLFYEVTGGAHVGSPLIDRLAITEKALWRVAKAFRALGFKVEKRNMQIPLKQIVGRTLVVKVSDGDEYNGETRSEIRDYAPAASFEGFAGEETDPTGTEATETTSEVTTTDSETSTMVSEGSPDVTDPEDGNISL